MPGAMAMATQTQPGAGASRPNIILIISDQFRWDCVGAMGVNPLNLTPNLDRMASRGVIFRSAFAAQPVCAPARASIFTGQYPCRHGVWRNGIALPENAVTLAKTLRGSGYSANYIGKWHLGTDDPAAVPRESSAGPVKPSERGGFLDLWEGSNLLEFTSHAYEGNLYDNDGRPIHYAGQYRTDFMTGRAQRFLRAARQPFFLTLSYLEVHHQNDSDTFDPPREYKGPKICARCPALGRASWRITTPASPKWTKPWARFAAPLPKPVSTATPSWRS
jgi:arylsulfatase A-like enzyme